MNPSSNSTKEVFDFAADMADVFARLGVLPPGNTGRTGTIDLTPTESRGVVLGVKNKDEAPAAAWAFGNALVQLGFQAEIQGAVPNLIPDAQTFLIRVAPKQ